jgi:arylsulfatase
MLLIEECQHGGEMMRQNITKLGLIFAIGVFVFGVVIAMPLAALAVQQDAEYYVQEKRFGEQWAAEDKEVQKKLAALQKKFGKKPNIIFILADDIGYTELGSYGGGIRGFTTPNLDQMAREGMRFKSYYSQPACTTTRIALRTGRFPVRNGIAGIIMPGTKGIGLRNYEVTVADLLSDAGYSTAMFGKWHMGGSLDDLEYIPTNNGFDEAEWSEGNPLWWGYNKGVKPTDPDGYMTRAHFTWPPGPDAQPWDLGGVMRATKGGKPEIVYPYSIEKYNSYDTEVADHTIDYIKRHAKGEKPFFIYYAGKGNHFFGANPKFMNTPAGTNNAAQMTEHDYNVGRVLDTLRELGIEENTLVIWSSDNGPMYAMHPHGGYSLLPGEKSETLEGGIRVPAIVSWPGMIEAFQEPDGIVDVTDWFTTVASIAGVKDKIPNDRVMDGVDQSSLLLLGEQKSRRDWNFHYNHSGLEAVRKDQIKFRLKAEVEHHFFYNIYFDPAERFPNMVEIGLWAGSPMQKLIQDHKKMIEKFPHQKPQTGHLADFDYPFDPDPTK